MNPPKYNALLAINKPAGLTSHDVVDQVRKILQQRSVGHTGTLDPLATGLILICLGKMTKLARFISDQEKTYQATIQLGLTSKTFDAEGIDKATARPVPELKREEAEAVIQSFVGRSMQTVPLHSAIRINGERLYEKARRGEEAEPPSREISIHQITINQIALPEISFTATVSSGTYIRSLAHDIGQKLGCGAYLKSLCRSSVGSMKLEAALTIEELAELVESEQVHDRFTPLATALPFGSVLVTDQFSARIAQGRPLTSGDVRGLQGEFGSGDHILIKNPAGDVLAVGTAMTDSVHFQDGSSSELFKYERVLV